MFLRILRRSLMRQWRRLALAGMALLLGGLLVAALTTLTLDIGAKVGKELRGYGANIVLHPPSSTITTGSGGLDFGEVAAERYIDEAALAVLSEGPVSQVIDGYVPYIYGVVEAAGQKVILAGALLERIPKLMPYWQLTGNWAAADDEQGVLVGSNVATRLGLDLGSPLLIKHRDNSVPLTVRGIVETGAAEDNQLFVNLKVAQGLFVRPGAVAMVQVGARTDRTPLAETVTALEQAMPGVKANIIGQIAEAEENIYRKIQLLMALVAALVLLAAALSVTSTMTTSVLERSREIGLLRALGASGGQVVTLFLTEAATIAIVGGALGCVLGVIVAQIIGQSVFNAAVGLHWQVVPITLIIAMSVALLASIAPVRRAVRVDPAVTLRGE